MAGTAGVTIEQVSFGYGAAPVLDKVSLAVGKGEFFAFLGPSGSGKTTLLRLIAGFGTPDQGRILVGDQDVTHRPPWLRNVGMVFQNYALWPHMTVAGNVAFGLEQRRMPRDEIRRRVGAVLELVGLGKYGDRRPAQLSGGQQQRVALARTLVIEPEVLLLDEPLSNLDAKLRVEMRAELIALQRKTGLTTIYVTHDQEEANATADRMAVLDQGRIQQIGAPLDLYDRPANRFVAGFLGAANLIDGTIEREGGQAVFRTPALSLALTGNPQVGAACLAFRPQSATLADAAMTSAPSALPGQVASREFLGTLVRYHVAIGPHRILVDALHQPGARVFDVGEAVALQLDPGQIHVLTA
jgi:iron(III) transport system ATP-binding protein